MAIVLSLVDLSEMRFFQRFAYLTEDSADGSSSARLEFWRLTLRAPESFSSLLFGNGVGMWPLDIYGQPEGYPHNIFIEFYYEHGLIGLLALGWMVAMLLGSRNTVVKYLALYFLAFLQLSGGLESMRWFMLFFALAIHDRGEV